MKGYILTILAIVAITTAVAQDAGYTFGVKVGMNIASAGLHGENLEGRDLIRSPRIGFSGGFTAEYKFEKPISISAELLFSQQGVKYNYDGQATVDGSRAKVTHRFSYLNLPILFNYYFVKDLPLSINVGIQPGYLLCENSTTKFTQGSVTEEWDYAYGWEGTYYKFDLSVPIGFTYGLTKNIVVDARYCIGVLNTFREPKDDDYEKDFRSTNNNFTISVGYRF